jgi:hypothetical protein
MHTVIINIKDNAFEKVNDLFKNISDIEIIDSRGKKEVQDRWVYWQDSELDNFGKIAIGLSKYDYNDEDYSKW